MAISCLLRLKKDDEGVASTVGTIMALLVVLTFMSLIVNQYVPVWSKDSEAAHMSSALGQFGEFKSDVDGQILSAQVAAAMGRSYVPTSTYSPVTLGIDGIPVFSSPTIGNLASYPDKGSWTIEFTYTIGTPTYRVSQTSSGNIVLYVANRYHIPQSIVFENGAIIIDQVDGEMVRVDPQFSASLNSGSLDVALTFIQLYGSSSVQGSTTEGIHSKVLGVDLQDYESITSSIFVNLTTDYGEAWFRFFNSTMGKALNVTASNFGSPGYSHYVSQTGETVITPYYVITRQKVGGSHLVTMEIIDGSTPIGGFTLDQAFVNIVIGQSGTKVGA